MKSITASKVQSKTSFTFTQRDIAASIGDDLSAQGYRVVTKTWDEKGNLNVEAIKEESQLNGKMKEVPKVGVKPL